MSASFVGEGSGPGGSNLWDPMPRTPPAPPTAPKPEEFLWSKPERLQERDADEPPKERTKGGNRAVRGRATSPAATGGRPVKKAARKPSKRRTVTAVERKRR